MRIWLLVISMAAVTYLPRLVPLVALSGQRMPKPLRRFLLNIPYAALGALLIPGALRATPELPVAGWTGMGVALLLAWHKGGLVVPVLSSVMVAFLILWGWGL
ncbi:MAG: AzlD domain-containing protein [Firmicutes bacterium]|jgi:branched-subunit amino acid transport protein|nr:AzlD domain-containing protein [Bacillota bacterium]